MPDRTFAFGDLRVVCSERLVILARATSAMHVTRFFDVMRNGPHRGKYWLHAAGNQQRQHVAEFSLEDSERFGKLITRCMRETWIAASCPVDLQTLTTEGWIVIIPAAQHWLEQQCGKRMVRDNVRTSQLAGRPIDVDVTWTKRERFAHASPSVVQQEQQRAITRTRRIRSSDCGDHRASIFRLKVRDHAAARALVWNGQDPAVVIRA